MKAGAIRGPATHPLRDQMRLLQEIKGKHTESHNEAGHRKPEVPEVIVVGLIECTSVAVALVHPIAPPKTILADR